MEADMLLSQLKPGESGEILEVGADEQIKKRLTDMGLIPKTVVRVIRTAPFGDPIEIGIMDYRLAIRKSEAKGISVLKVGGGL